MRFATSGYTKCAILFHNETNGGMRVTRKTQADRTSQRNDEDGDFRIPDTPENIAWAIMQGPPKKDWDYLKNGNAADDLDD